jgi:hypothetical protein
MHDNLNLSLAVRPPPAKRSTPKQEKADGKDNGQTEHVIGPIINEHPEQKEKNGDPTTAEQGRQHKAPKQSLSAGATNQFRFPQLGYLVRTIVWCRLSHKQHLC